MTKRFCDLCEAPTELESARLMKDIPAAGSFAPVTVTVYFNDKTDGNGLDLCRECTRTVLTKLLESF